MLSQFKQKLITIFVSFPAKVIASLFVFYCLFGYFAVNPLAQKLLPWIAEEKLASKASVGQVTFDPLQLKVTIENFKLTEKNDAILAGFANLTVDFESSSILNWAWKFKEISIGSPQAKVAISPQGKLNWENLLAKLDEDKSTNDNSIPRLVIEHISIKRGNIEYVDANRTKPLKVVLAPLDFELGKFSTLPKDRGDYLIAANLPEHGGKLKWKGNIGVNPIASKGFVSVDDVKLDKLMHIIKGVELPFTARNGIIQTKFKYSFSLPKDLPKLTLNKVTIDLQGIVGDVPIGNVSLKTASLKIPDLDFEMSDTPLLKFQDLSVKFLDLKISKGKEPLLYLPQIDIHQVSLDLAMKQAKIGQVFLPHGLLNAVMDRKGAFNWQAEHTEVTKVVNKDSKESTSDKSTTANDESPFMLDIADIQLQHWKLQFINQALLNPLQVNVNDFNLGLSLSMPEGNAEVKQIQSTLINTMAKVSPSNQVASIDKIQLTDGEIKLAENQVNISSLVLSGLKTQLIKDANKTLNWQTILTPAIKDSKSSPASHATQKSDWALSLKKFIVENANLHIEDRSLNAPVVLDFEKINVEVNDSSENLKRSLPIKATFKIKQGGQFSSQGKLTPLPFATDLDLKLSNFSLKPLGSYVNQFALLKLNEGSANISGKLGAKTHQDLSLIFNGGFGINNLQITEEVGDAPFLSWESLFSNSLKVSLLPNQVYMAQLDIVKPQGKFIINQDKTMNVQRIQRNQSGAAAIEVPVKEASNAALQVKTETTGGMLQAAKSSINSGEEAVEDKTSVSLPENEGSTEDPFPVNIDTLRINDAALEFADFSLTPQFGTNIHSLTGVINGISTNASSTAQVELDGRVDDYGAARIRGSLQPFKATNFTDIKLTFTNLEMNRLTPYSGKFAGRRIDSGKLSVDLEYKINQRQLAGENKFVINKLKLGEKIESADAANLPLDLAIAILEDSDGVIDLELPITGSLDDPKFSYGSIVWKAIKNVLGKIVTAPFRALGKLFGGDGDKLQAIVFEAGSAKLSPPEFEKLKMVSNALAKRQGLLLGILPSYDEGLDSASLQQYILRRKVAEEIGLTLAEGQAAGPIDLNNAKTRKAIDELYDNLTKKSLFKKLASKLEKPKEGHYEEALEKLTLSIQVTEQDLQALAKSRGIAIQEALVAAGVGLDRLNVESPEKSKSDPKTDSVNTKLILKVKQS